MPVHPTLSRRALSVWVWVCAGCDPVLDVGTWLGASPSVMPTSPLPTPTRPNEPMPGPPDSGLPPFDSGLTPLVDAGDGGADTGVRDSGTSDAGDVGAVDSGMECTFPPDVDLNVPAEPREWTTVIEVPWSTGFEDGFCDFTPESGYCYADSDAAYDTVVAPARSGVAAAAFSVATAGEVAGVQARCVRRGLLPNEAYYGAWYLIPERARTAANWNLFHFLGGNGAERKGLWDVSIRSGADGQLFLYIRDFFSAVVYEPQDAPPLPVGEWVHVQFYLRRAADMTGEIALYQNGDLLHRLTNVITDDTEQGAWYLGNLADDLMPADVTIYVDDVTISESL